MLRAYGLCLGLNAYGLSLLDYIILLTLYAICLECISLGLGSMACGLWFKA